MNLSLAIYNITMVVKYFVNYIIFDVHGNLKYLRQTPKYLGIFNFYKPEMFICTS